jgi:hypothetical protein
LSFIDFSKGSVKIGCIRTLKDIHPLTPRRIKNDSAQLDIPLLKFRSGIF